jgi:predicted Zn-dependent protease
MTGLLWTEEDIFLVAQRGHALFLQGRYEEATIVFEGLVASDPSNVYCTNALAALLIKQGKVARAIELLDRILEMYPNDADSRMRRCEAFLVIGRRDDARKDLQILKRFSSYRLTRLEMLMELAEKRDEPGSNFRGLNSITKGVKELSS